MKIFIKYFLTLVVLVNFLQAQGLVKDTIDVKSGWNMIGALYSGAIKDIITTTPPSIIASSFFCYDASYKQTDTLKKGDGYWVKVSQAGIIMMNAPSVIDTSCPATVSYDGKNYNTVKIGSQCWFKENIDVGTMIDSLQDQTNNGIIEKYCYNNDINNCNTYGGLYQWNEAVQYNNSSGTKGICPDGWHVPSLYDYEILNTTVDGDGNSLKAVGQGIDPGAGTDISGFSALASGSRATDGGFNHLGTSFNFWSSSENIELLTYAYLLHLYYDMASISLSYGGKDMGLSVRCIKD